ncbi:hypothetical protein [Nocardioides sp.]|uniref:hypothetical protein n=1 Tax=Nocardioides sp. TaxID=35761 RepID=UPI002728CF70|nr:hypothetical protein [Nocardioides sp.]MDO9454499.1 hypothetical protein [Nocardioides sp.]
MADEFYLDYAGAGSARSRFASRATELETAAVDGAKGTVTGMQGPMGAGTAPVQSAADDLLMAASGRLRAYGVELHALAELINDTIVVTNEIDVEYTL